MLVVVDNIYVGTSYRTLQISTYMLVCNAVCNALQLHVQYSEY